MYDGWQILPEKYSYYRRFDQDTNHATDCVICMTAIDIMQRSNECMVCSQSTERGLFVINCSLMCGRDLLCFVLD